MDNFLLGQDLELRINNPYSIGAVFGFDEGDYLLDRSPLVIDRSTYDSFHTVIEGETLGQIAFDKYGNSKWWWVIYDANDIYNPFDLETGLELVIPDLDRVKVLLS